MLGLYLLLSLALLGGLFRGFLVQLLLPFLSGGQSGDPVDGRIQAVGKLLLLGIARHKRQLADGVLHQLLGIGFLVFQFLHRGKGLQEFIFAGLFLQLFSPLLGVLLRLFLCLGGVHRPLLFVHDDGIAHPGDNGLKLIVFGLGPLQQPGPQVAVVQQRQLGGDILVTRFHIVCIFHGLYGLGLKFIYHGVQLVGQLLLFLVVETLLCPQLRRGAEVILHACLFIGPQLHSLRLLPIQGRQVRVDFVHNIFPDFTGIGAAVHAGHIPGDFVAHPHRGGVIAGVAAEPGVAACVGGAGFSGGRHVVCQGKAAAGAVGGGHGSLQNIRQHEHRILPVDLFGGRGHVLCQISVVFVFDALDTGAVIVDAVVGQRAVALGHVHHADPVGEAADA